MIQQLRSESAATLALATLREIGRRKQARPIATYRLQFQPKFTFQDAAKIVPYLAELGLSHVYASPYFQARSGSADGYCICDYNALSSDLGGDAGYEVFLEALREHRIEQIVDFVPNHMAASTENAWWFNVLENGPSSPYATYFDIDWNPVTPELSDKLLLPVLGQQYGRALEAGELKLSFDQGAFFVHYYETRCPIAPETSTVVLSQRIDALIVQLGDTHPDVVELQSIVTGLQHLPSQMVRDTQSVLERQREKEVLKQRLSLLVGRSEAVAKCISSSIELFNGQPQQPASFDLLDQLLSAQAYRLCYWRAAADEINYRRFFDVNELAAVCMENAAVFWHSHQLIRRLLASGAVAGLRIDHIDGLLDPERYLWRLQWAYLADVAEYLRRNALAGSADSGNDLDQEWKSLGVEVLVECCWQLNLPRPDHEDLLAIFGPDVDIESAAAENAAMDRDESPVSQRDLPLYVLVEKILGPQEPLPKSWALAGTTGYDYLNVLNGLSLADEGWESLIRTFRRLDGADAEFEAVVRESKLATLRVTMAGELQMLAHRLNQISELHRRSRDFTLNMLRHAIQEVLASFSVYRVYPTASGLPDRDRQFIHSAIAKARRRNPTTDPALFDFLKQILLLEHPSGASGEAIDKRRLFAGRFQQVASPVMAKGVEDTAFYVFVPLVSANEVGGHPTHPTTTIDEFHRLNVGRQEHFRQTLLATSTHDTKRSEDVRARLNVLSEVPQAWHTATQRWSRLNRHLRREVDGEPAPSAKDEYLFYQALLGIWPGDAPSEGQREELRDRLQKYMEKATHESKQRTSWIHPNREYDTAVSTFIASALEDSTDNAFMTAFHEFHASIVDAGQYNAFFQQVLKLLSPGVPDVYQGQELWDYSLVDPDNRRVVNYGERKCVLADLAKLDEMPPMERGKLVQQMGQNPRDVRLKPFVIQTLLRLRRSELFDHGQYVPLAVLGEMGEHLVAFGWREREANRLSVLVVVPRQVHGLLTSAPAEMPGLRLQPEAWRDARIELAEPPGRGTDLFTGEQHELQESMIQVGRLLERFPVAVLTFRSFRND